MINTGIRLLKRFLFIQKERYFEKIDQIISPIWEEPFLVNVFSIVGNPTGRILVEINAILTGGSIKISVDEKAMFLSIRLFGRKDLE